jgi:hypothetical protein
MITLIKRPQPSQDGTAPVTTTPSPRTPEDCYAHLIPDERTRVATVFAGMLMLWAPFNPAGAFLSVARQDATLGQLAGRDLSMVSASDLAMLHRYVRGHYPDLFAQIMERPAVREILGDCLKSSL